jgi:hypothetical protein
MKRNDVRVRKRRTKAKLVGTRSEVEKEKVDLILTIANGNAKPSCSHFDSYDHATTHKSCEAFAMPIGLQAGLNWVIIRVLWVVSDLLIASSTWNWSMKLRD